ncbi:MAG TPA: 50S ribosomal protein L9 [Terriglobales bacterium]|nr:50S ribosomal protein L9 [Terriglobales bacterium]
MEIILKEDVQKLGNKGDVVKVADGYARNYLLPRKLAILATPGNLKNVEQMRAAARRKEAKNTAEAQALAEQLGKLALRFARRAGEHDTLFGSVTSMDIAGELEAKGFNIDRRKIELREPLKSLGEFKVPVHLYRDVVAHLAVTVEREGEPEAASQ